MKNRIKSYWSNCLSIAAIICSVVAICVSLPSAPELGIDYIGVIVGILSLLVTMLIGWQIWNAMTIEKKISDEVKKVKDSISKEIENMRNNNFNALQKLLFKATITDINLYASKGDYNQVIESLKLLLCYANSINEVDFYKNAATVVAWAKYEIDGIVLSHSDDRDIINSTFDGFVRKVLIQLPASDEVVKTLFTILDEIRVSNEERRKYKESVDEKSREEQKNDD